MVADKKAAIVRAVTFAAGMAVVVGLFPAGAELPAKPAGIRTAIELLEKRNGGLPRSNVQAAMISGSC